MPARSYTCGFTLIEVMVALVITAIGLLGIAKIQALAYASTGSAGTRSLIALQAAGLASSMHANRNYWAGLAASPIVITGASITTPAAMDAVVTNCTGGTYCLPDILAAYDLHSYAAALNGMLGNSNPVTTITCANIPTSCSIQVTWNEHALSVNTQSQAATSQNTFLPTYTLYVEP